MKLLINAPLVGEIQTGQAVHLTELLRAMLIIRPTLAPLLRHSSARGGKANRQSASRIGTRVKAKTIPIPATLLNPVQAQLRVPSERLLFGNFDVYHLFHTDSSPAVPSERLVITVHDTVQLRWPNDEGPMNARARPLLRRAAAVVTVSNFSKEMIAESFDVTPEQITVVHNGVNAARFSLATAAAQESKLRQRLGFDAPYLLFIGGGTPRKNVPRIIQAFSRVRTAIDDDLQLVLAGPVNRYAAELMQAAPRDLSADAVHFVGYIPEDEIAGLYGGAAALVYPSLYEGFGMPVLEAMSCGVTVVTSNTTALPEVAGTAGILVDPEDVDSIAVGLLLALQESNDDARRRHDEGHLHASRFLWDESAQKVLSIYDSIASR